MYEPCDVLLSISEVAIIAPHAGLIVLTINYIHTYSYTFVYVFV